MRTRWASILQILVLVGLLGAVSASAADDLVLSRVSDAERHLAAGEYGAAISAYLAALELTPHEPGLSLRLARAYLGRQDAGGALPYLYRAYAAARGRQRAEAAALLGRAWAMAGQGNEAERWWRLALSVDPYDREARLGLAELFDGAGDQGAAAYQLRLVLGHRPDDAEASYRLGLVLLDLDRRDALDALGRAAAANEPFWSDRAQRLLVAAARTRDDAYGAAQMGMALWELRELRPAWRQFELAAGRDPAYAAAHAYRGYLRSELGLPALGALEMALRLEPDLVIGHYLLGRYYQRHGLADAARQELETASRLAPDNPAIKIDLAHACAEAGDYTSAEGWIESLAEGGALEPDLAMARARFFVERAYRVEDLGLAAIEDAMRLAPDAGEAYALRGRALYLLERYHEAVEALGQAVALEPDDAAIRGHYGMALRTLGREDEARWQLERAVDLDPEGVHGRWGRLAGNAS